MNLRYTAATASDCKLSNSSWNTLTSNTLEEGPAGSVECDIFQRLCRRQVRIEYIARGRPAGPAQVTEPRMKSDDAHHVATGRGRVLVIDNDSSMVLWVRSVLQADGYECFPA